MPLERLRPRMLEKVWGSAQLAPWFTNAESKIGEVWFEGIPDLPLLVKFLFTTDKLSVQVHPGDAYAAQHHSGSRGKTEMWHVLAAEPGAQIAAGLREPVSPERLRSAALSGEIENLLEWHDAAPGDTFFLPAGTVHTIGGGLVLCEVQQSSDITYRLYDYGRPRELHLDDAVAVAHRGRCEVRKAPAGDVLVSCEHFTVARNQTPGATRGFQLLIAIAGAGTVASEPVRAGEVLYVPPGNGPLTAEGDLILLAASE